MKRLEAIFSLINPCVVFVDIGCDHGLIAEYALGYAKKIIASDISEKCLSKARKLLSVHQNVYFVVSDGFKNIKDSADLAVIAGMGGHTIVDILADYFIAFNNSAKTQLIVQPQSEACLVRKFLSENGYLITDDLIACDSGKFYEVIKAKSGQEKLSEMQLKYGKFYKQKCNLLKQKLQLHLSRLKSYKQTSENQQLCIQIERALQWQK